LKKFEDILVQCIEDIRAGRSSIETAWTRIRLCVSVEPLLKIALGPIREPPDVTSPSPSGFKAKG
jgi:hypothetical protein